MSNKLKTSMKTLLFMLIISVVCVGGVSTAYVMTKDLIRINEQMLEYQSVLFAAGITIPENPEDVVKVYQQNVEEIKDPDGGILFYKIAGNRYAMNCTGTGLWGEIKAVVCFNQSLKIMEGIAFTYQNETPGLGGRIEENWFKEQFRGKLPPVKMVNEGEKTTDNEFDAITGATITSTGVMNMVNKVQKIIQDKVKAYSEKTTNK